ncbi:hypothetical protein [Microbacterium sp. No. 7]|uniref:hypothetical protein n=1 Tax=Microbacterium sp. No. 7 TaxID=1714373 RepID=UPI0006CFEA4A|nr:hypothetical protein [Microbacterium sp. No. 7]ALJ19079.1 hypothetical protein AOA12_03830 [Microbacterium sp. No. 7]
MSRAGDKDDENDRGVRVTRRTFLALSATAVPVASLLASSYAALPAAAATTATVDPRDHLAPGETWTGVSDIRPAFQAALDAAHALAADGEDVEFVIPPGVGRIGSTQAWERVPIVRESDRTPKALYPKEMGFGLRVNLMGSIHFRGAGGWNRASVIRLQDNAARNLFYIDTDTGVEWVDLGMSYSPAGTTATVRAERPAEPAIFRNFTFTGFAVDNNFTTGNGHIVIGTVPAWSTRQTYVCVQNIEIRDIDVFGVADKSGESSAIWFSTVHVREAEANPLANGLTHPWVSMWQNWSLDTYWSRQTAYANGWTWMTDIRISQVRTHNTALAVGVVAYVGRHYSIWMDGIEIDDVIHTQDTHYQRARMHCSVYVGGNIVGGSATVRNIAVTNIGDDSLEIGGFREVLVENMVSVNANRAGIIIRYSQRPQYPSQTRVTIRNYRNVVTGDAIRPGAVKQSFRGSPIDIFYDRDGDVDPSTGVQRGDIYPLAFLTIEDSSSLIDGTTSDGVDRGEYSILERAGALGWTHNWQVGLVTMRRVSAAVRHFHLGHPPNTEFPMNLIEGQHPDTRWDVEGLTLEVEDVTSSGRQMMFYATCLHSRKPIRLANVVGILRDTDNAAVSRFVATSPGYKPHSVAPDQIYVGGIETIDGVRVISSGTTTAMIRGVSVANHQPVASIAVRGVDVLSAPGAIAINLPLSGANAGITVLQ